MNGVKSESNLAKSHICLLESAHTVANKCVKRRRRDSSTVGCKDKQADQLQPQADQSAATATPVKRSSRFRGVSRHRWTGRYEAHLWDKGSWNPTQRKKGKQGAYDVEESAARAYDLAALKYWGTSTFTNFPVSDYEKEIEIMKTVSKEEYLASLRRRSSGFSRGVSKYRGVARHHHNGRWEARIGRVFGNKYLYLGTYSTQEEAAHAYDIAAIEYRGINAVTNFDLSTYIRWLRPGANSHASQEQISTTPPCQSVSTSSNLIPIKEIKQTPVFHSNPFMEDDLDTSKQHDIFQRQLPISPCTKTTSPTALGLLLKSSIYRELVEKNSNSQNEESIENDMKNLNLPLLKNDDSNMVSYDVIPDINFTGSGNAEALPGLEAQEEETTLPLCNGKWQSLWNNTLNMSNSIPFN
ncbi:hypothetical protein FEM48_Zijuj10G0073800 [Ziziphus jujuba var. spinosa]|uniref:AP2/ERF domain-containing protein n=1 Tax=Ziziphus jujuba var. spinosa TaxID=714518 RepID=A0A978UM33_ZIZJJ|nr:hypothetical protein FEM48_Zijuj10G0073800 [Ziziphus jujuba var. spinosa]